MDKISIKVPYANAAKSIVDTIMNDMVRELSARELVEIIYCKDFFSMDYESEFHELLDKDVDSDTYDLVHQFIDSKSYDRKCYIQFLAKKLPENYDLKAFPKELLRQMIDASKQTKFVFNNEKTATVYDTEKMTYTTLDNDYGCVWKFKSHPTLPIVAIRYRKMLVVYDIISIKIIIEIPTLFAEEIKMFDYFFATNNNSFYVIYPSFVHVFDINSFEIVARYDLGSGNIRLINAMDNSPDGKFAALLIREQGLEVLSVLDLLSGNLEPITSSDSLDFQFVNNNTFAYRYIIGNKSEIVLYNCETRSEKLLDPVKAEQLEPIFYKHRTNISHPCSNNFVSYLSESDPYGNYNGSTFRSDQLERLNTILTTRGLFYKSQSCFSSDGKYIYSLMKNMIKCQITKHRLHADGTISLKRTFVIDIAKVIFFSRIVAVSYEDPELLQKIGHFVE